MLNRLKDKSMDCVIPLLPKEDLSHWVGRAAHVELPRPLAMASVAAFAKAYGINVSEAERPIGEYRSIGEFFTRRLKPGVRPQRDGITHPCDARITEAAAIDDGRLFQAKGITYSAAALIGDDERAERYRKGAFVTYYLCPTDYHRVHLPLAASAVWRKHIPGTFWPVNAWSVRAIANLYSVNERVAIEFQTEYGERLMLVLVAATNVGNIKIAFDNEVSTGLRDRDRRTTERVYQPPISLKKGDEVGHFAMGSTVVALFDSGLCSRFRMNDEGLISLRDKVVRVGESLSSV